MYYAALTGIGGAIMLVLNVVLAIFGVTPFTPWWYFSVGLIGIVTVTFFYSVVNLDPGHRGLLLFRCFEPECERLGWRWKRIVVELASKRFTEMERVVDHMANLFGRSYTKVACFCEDCGLAEQYRQAVASD